jgi:hypothetical protein
MSRQNSAARSVGAAGPRTHTIDERQNGAAHAPSQALVLTTRAELTDLVREAVAAAIAEQSESRPVERQVVGPNEMSRMLDISRTSLHRLRSEGCPAVRLGDVYKYEPSAVLTWLKARGKP